MRVLTATDRQTDASAMAHGWANNPREKLTPALLSQTACSGLQ